MGSFGEIEVAGRLTPRIPDLSGKKIVLVYDFKIS